MDEQRVRELAELEVRRYFDHYLQDVLPQQLKALKHHTHTTVEAHDNSPDAHGGVEKKVNRFMWMLLGGATFVGGSVGALFKTLLG